MPHTQQHLQQVPTVQTASSDTCLLLPPPPAAHFKACVHKYGGQWDGRACTVYQFLHQLRFRLDQLHNGTWALRRGGQQAAAGSHLLQVGSVKASAAAPAGALGGNQAAHVARADPDDLDPVPEVFHEDPTGDQMHQVMHWHRIGLFGGQQGEPSFMPLAAEYAPRITLEHSRDPGLVAEQIRSTVYVGVKSADRMYTVGLVLVVLGCMVMLPVLAMGLFSMYAKTRDQRKAQAHMEASYQYDASPSMAMEKEMPLSLNTMRFEVQCYSIGE